jgi:hypothetical protein
MIRKKDRVKIIDFLYGEMDQKGKENFSKKLEQQKNIKNTLNILAETRKDLSSWKIPKMKKNLIKEAVYRADRKDRSFWHFLPIWFKAVSSCGIVLIFLALINLDISFSKEGFSMKFSFFPKSESVNNEKRFNEIIENNRRETLKLVTGYIQDSNKLQIEEVNYLLSNYEEQDKIRRKYELQAIFTELEKLKLSTGKNFLYTNNTLEGIIKYVAKMGDSINTKKTSSI